LLLLQLKQQQSWLGLSFFTVLGRPNQAAATTLMVLLQQRG
jgi:hypothetical protein